MEGGEYIFLYLLGQFFIASFIMYLLLIKQNKKEAMLTFFQREINKVPFLKILCGFAQLSFDVPCSFLVYSPNSSWWFKSLF